MILDWSRISIFSRFCALHLCFPVSLSNWFYILFLIDTDYASYDILQTSMRPQFSVAKHINVGRRFLTLYHASNRNQTNGNGKRKRKLYDISNILIFFFFLKENHTLPKPWPKILWEKEKRIINRKILYYE